MCSRVWGRYVKRLGAGYWCCLVLCGWLRRGRRLFSPGYLFEFLCFLFKGSELVSMPEATATEKVIFAIKAFVAQVLSTIFFVSMMFPAMAARF